MKILILTHSADRHYYFATQLVEGVESRGIGEVIGVITGGKKIHRSKWQKLRAYYLNKHWQTNLRNVAINRLHGAWDRKLLAEKQQAEQQFFDDATRYFQKQHAEKEIATIHAPHRSINAPHYVDLIQQLKPDAICVMGTCMIGKAIIESAPLVLNIHTGLSPHYRGDRTNFWPFLEEDYGYFGVTVHTMSLGIDSGDIVYSERVHPEPGDGFPELNCRAIQLGCARMLDALQDAKNNALTPTPQWTKGKLFFNRDYNASQAKRYYAIKDSFLKQYNDHQQGGTLDAPREIV